MRRGRGYGPALAALVLACGGLSDGESVALVKRYNARKIEAYRAGDPRLVDPVTSVREGQKILGLIGVKLDLGMTLDARILEFEVLGVERRGDEVVVRSEERWHYLERRIGTGEQVGQESTDRYSMRYHLRRDEGRWVVDGIEFAREPEVGRKELPNAGAPRAMHGMPSRAPETGPSPAPTAPGREGTR